MNKLDKKTFDTNPVGKPENVRFAKNHMDRGGAQQAMKAVVKDGGIKRRALKAIQHCRTPEAGEVYVLWSSLAGDKKRKQWKKLKGKYLFHEFALASVFRARFLASLSRSILIRYAIFLSF